MSRSRILVVDDEVDISTVLSVTLRRAGFDVRTASDGIEAIEAIRQELPDLVILDVMMPVMDGYEVLRAMKADPVTKSIPVIMLTARGLEQDILKGFDNGAVDYVVKPFSVTELAARIKTNLVRAKTA